MDGTSFAAPIVASVVAQMLGLTRDEIEAFGRWLQTLEAEHARRAAENLARSNEFLAKNGKRKGVVTTSEEKIADVNAQAPVGTTQALIEQGAAVFSAIHARLHDSQARVLKILGRLNRWYLDDQRKGEVVADLEIERQALADHPEVELAELAGIYQERGLPPDLALEVAEGRDVKGLYAKAAAGNLPNLTGVGQEYEPPRHPDLVLDGTAEEIGAEAEAGPAHAAIGAWRLGLQPVQQGEAQLFRGT